MDTEMCEGDGSVHSIHVRNFFCHDNLEIHLNRNVNFIVGRNGSGKSAILTALVVGLGGRASATNRGSNLHSFIKKGANSATIEIKIKNSSPRAYKHHIYGDFITIIRTINASGGSSYKIKSAAGEIISTKFEEVNSIIIAHDIQVDNPISVLNQDDARSFHASDAKKKYLLFRRATNLDQTEINYLKSLENCKKAMAIWKRKSEACNELEKEYKKWKSSYEKMQSREEMEANKKALQHECYWSEITDLKKETDTVQSQYEKQKARIEKLVEKLNNLTEHYGSNTETIDTLKKQLNEKKLEKLTLEKELSTLEGEARENQNSFRNAQNVANKQRALFNREKSKVNVLESEINNIDSGRSASKRAELERSAETTRKACEAARARYDTAQHDASQARANAAHAQAEAERASERATHRRNTIIQLKQQLRELESRGNDSLAVYGNNMAVLCQEINKAVKRGEFSAPPRGPVGVYLKVKDKKWAGALEHIIGGSVQSFCVNSPEDSRKLFEIMGRVYGNSPKPSVTCSKFLNQRHNVRKHQVKARGFSSALEALDVTDTAVYNFLVDNVSLERILLVDDHDTAIRLSDTVENVPENCARIITPDGTEYHPAPRYRSYGGAGRASRYLQVSTGERKRQVMGEIEEAQKALRSMEETAERLQQEAREARENERGASRTLQALLADRHQKEEAARTALAALEQAQAPHHALLIEELNLSREKLQTLQNELESLAAQEDQYKQKADELDERMERIKRELSQIIVVCRNLNEEVEQAKLKLEQGITERQSFQQKLQEDQSKIAQVEAILEEKQNVIKEKVEHALKLGSRVENPRDLALVVNELKKMQLKLSSIRSDGMTKLEVGEKLADVERKYQSTKSSLDQLKILIEEIKETTNKHLHFSRKMQAYITSKVQHCFQAMLDLRGYSGRMDIDNNRGVLEIFCTGRESASKRHASSTSSLSGGERSYSTVAFIMALWECVELPFYFMDEFDVFMDNVNRKIVMELLIDYALKNNNRQFVFLTPQDASAVVASPQISIHLMPDPRP